jgi:CRP-like cAMP-binding protein
MRRFLPKNLPRRQFPSGDTIFEQDTPASCAFVVEQGMVEISRRQGARRRVLGHIGPGGIFGEMALIDDQPRMARATAVGDTTCLVIEEFWFRAKLRAADPAIRGLLRIFVRNIRSLSVDP